MRDEPPAYTLTLRQPYAWAVIYAHKNIENRSWPPPPAIQGTGGAGPYKPGRILIHAGLTLEQDGIEFCRNLGIKLPEAAYRGGAIIGSVEVVGFHERGSGSPGCTDDCFPWGLDDVYHWKLARPRRVRRAIACTGRAGLFRPPAGWSEAF